MEKKLKTGEIRIDLYGAEKEIKTKAHQKAIGAGKKLREVIIEGLISFINS